MPFSQQSYQGGGGEPRQIFNRSGEILGSGLNRAFEILAASAGRKAEKDELRKRRTQFIQGQEKALKAILDEDLPDEYYDLPDDAKASYLDSYTTNVLPEIKAERERERLKEAWSSVAGQYGIDPNVPAEFIDDLIGFQQQTQFENMRQGNRIELERMQSANALNYLREQNQSRLDTERSLLEMRDQFEREQPKNVDWKKLVDQLESQDAMDQASLSVSQLLQGLPDDKITPEVKDIALQHMGDINARSNMIDELLRRGFFRDSGTTDYSDDGLGDPVEKSPKKSSKSSRAPKDNREPVNVGKILNERARGYTPYGSGPTY